jgi:hypothetical protein
MAEIFVLGHVASVPDSDYKNSMLYEGPDSNRCGDLRTRLVHNDEACVPFRMTSPGCWMFWILSLSRSRATSQLGLAFEVRCVVGRPARKTSGLAPADTSGTRSILEQFVPPASIGGLQRGASRAPTGRRIRIGIRINVSG